MTTINPNSPLIILNQNEWIKNPQEGIHYEFVDNGGNFLAFRILYGDYKDVVYYYEYVNLVKERMENSPYYDDIVKEFEDDEDDYQAVLKFDYQVVKAKGTVDTKHNPDFELLIGNILSKVLMEAASDKESRYSMFTYDSNGQIVSLTPPNGNKNSLIRNSSENRTSNLEKSDNKRGIFEKIFAFLKGLVFFRTT